MQVKTLIDGDKTMKRLMFITVICAFMAAPAMADLNLLTNPGAETGDLTGWTVINESEGGPVGALPGLYDPPFTPLTHPDEIGPHSGSYIFSSSRTTPTSSKDYWQVTQTVDVTTRTKDIVMGSVWIATNSTEYARLILTEILSDSSTNRIYDSDPVGHQGQHSTDVWTELSSGWITINPDTCFIEFMVTGLKPAGAGQYNSASFDDAFLAVPVPGAVLLGIIGLGAVGLKLRKYA
jgi:hypothetical protein